MVVGVDSPINGSDFNRKRNRQIGTMCFYRRNIGKASSRFARVRIDLTLGCLRRNWLGEVSCSLFTTQNQRNKNHIIRTCMMYHAACKVEFQPFKRLYSADVFQLSIIKFFQKRWISRHRWPAVFWSSILFSEQPRYCSVVDSKWDISGPTRNKRRAPPTRWT